MPIEARIYLILQYNFTQLLYDTAHTAQLTCTLHRRGGVACLQADREFKDRSTHLFMDLLEEGNLFLQTLNAPLQVQPGQSGIVYILGANTDTQKIIATTNRKDKKVQGKQEIESEKMADERDKRDN